MKKVREMRNLTYDKSQYSLNRNENAKFQHTPLELRQSSVRAPSELRQNSVRAPSELCMNCADAEERNRKGLAQDVIFTALNKHWKRVLLYSNFNEEPIY